LSALAIDWPDQTANHPTPKLSSAIGGSHLPALEPLEHAKALETAVVQAVEPTVAMVDSFLKSL
jgi:hypothetical protein